MAYLRRPSVKNRQSKATLKERTKQAKEWIVSSYHTNCTQSFAEYLEHCEENKVVPIRYTKFLILFAQVKLKGEPERRMTMYQQRNMALLTAVQRPNADVVAISEQYKVSIRNITRIAKTNGTVLPDSFPWHLAKQNKFTAKASGDYLAKQTTNSIARWHKWYSIHNDTANHYQSYCLYCSKRKKPIMAYKTFAPAFKKFLEEEPVRQARLAKDRLRKRNQ